MNPEYHGGSDAALAEGGELLDPLLLCESDPRRDALAEDQHVHGAGQREPRQRPPAPEHLVVGVGGDHEDAGFVHESSAIWTSARMPVGVSRALENVSR